MDSKGQYGSFGDHRKSSLLLVMILSFTAITMYWSELIRTQKPHVIVSNSWAPTKPSGSKIMGKKVATIIENRKSDKLIPLILHFSSVLGPSWPIVIYTSLSQSDLDDSAPFKEGLSNGQFELRSLPEPVNFTNHKDVSSFLTKPWIWEQLAPADHVLLFQADSILCANAPKHVDDYLQYDMIGAPIAFGMGQGYNGGLSLRNRRKMLDIAKKHNWEDAWDAAMRSKAQMAENERLVNEQAANVQKEKSKEDKPQIDQHGHNVTEAEKVPNDQSNKSGQNVTEVEKMPNKRQETGPPAFTWVFPDNPTPPWDDYEDQWFFKHLAQLPRTLNGKRGANLPLMDIAMTFSVETVYYDTPLGYHQVGLMFEDKIDEIEKWCPEYHLCTDKRFKNAG